MEKSLICPANPPIKRAGQGEGRTMPVIAISLSMTWGARNIVRSGLLAQLTNNAKVIVIFRLPQPQLQETCEKLGAEVWVMPEDDLRWAGSDRLTSWLDRAHKVRGNFRSSKFRPKETAGNRSWVARGKARLRESGLKLLARKPVYQWCCDWENRRLQARAYDSRVAHYLKEQNIDLLLFTSPFQGVESSLMHAAKSAGVKTVSLVLGFDNVSTKKRQPVQSDYYCTWNETMRQEVLNLFPLLPPENVVVTGSPQFDFYASELWGGDEASFRKKLGLRSSGPLLLYAAGSGKYIPEEPLLVLDLIRRLHSNEEMTGLSVLIRLHPYERDESRWKALEALDGVIITRPWETDQQREWGNITEEEIHLLCGSLRHCQCVVNICSTMALDAIFFDRPVVAPAYHIDPEPAHSLHVRRLYEQEHFRPVSESGAIQLVQSPAEAEEAVIAAMRSPARQRMERISFTRQMLGRPVGGSATFICQLLTQLTRSPDENRDHLQ